MSFVLLGILNSQAAGAAQTYFLGLLEQSGETSDRVGEITSDSLGFIYGATETKTATSVEREIFVFQTDSEGVVQWQKAIGQSLENEVEPTRIVADSADNVYISATKQQVFQDDEIRLAKLNSSGAIQWQIDIASGSGDERVGEIAIDTSDNILVAGRSDTAAGSGSDIYIVKVNSSGTVQWQKYFGDTDNQGVSPAIATDSSDNVYVAFSDVFISGNFTICLAKFNSSGSLQWQKYFETDSSEIVGGPGNLVVDSNDDVIVACRTAESGFGSNDVSVIKVNSSGSEVWNAAIGSAQADTPTGLATDSSNNIYVFFDREVAVASVDNAYIVKYDSSGTIQFQREIDASKTFASGFSINTNDDMLFLADCELVNTSDLLFGKLPNDGSLTGTYTLGGETVEYSASSLSTGTISYSTGNASFTVSSASLTTSSSSMTSEDTSFTEQLTEL